ncbi:MAG: hypothetical protein II816_04695 [Elusimicrobia bacterium]|nr:hypothetical protein [Elusimicrobiota bacterium]
MLKNNKAFTLTELIVTISMIITLVITWAFYGRGHVKVAMLNEGRLFADQIIAQEKNYFSNAGTFLSMSAYTTKAPALFIDAKTNKYFTAFKVAYGGDKKLTVIVKDTTNNDDNNFTDVKVTAVYNPADGSIVYTDAMN